MALRALVFDFDGLLVDTEQTSYQAWRERFAAQGVELALTRWLRVVGTHDAGWDPVTELEELTGERVDRDTLVRAVRERHHALADAQPCRPGTRELVDEAAGAGVALAVASSSNHGWVERHLERLGLRERFGAVVGRDLVGGNGKPAPDVYTEALRRVDVDAADAAALEDSRHGVRSATAAGLAVVAVPNAITRGMDFTGARAVLDSLEGVDLRALCELTGQMLDETAPTRPTP